MVTIKKKCIKCINLLHFFQTVLSINKLYLFIDNNEVYIDSTIIMNKYGTRNTTGYNTYECKKHRSNKISVIASRNSITARY